MGRQSQRQTKQEKRMAMWNAPLKQALKLNADEERDLNKWSQDLQQLLFPPTPDPLTYRKPKR